jgi:hypothetical protein
MGKRGRNIGRKEDRRGGEGKRRKEDGKEM